VPVARKGHALMASDMASWGKVIRDGNIRIE
jgi:hypothetical protein